MRKIVVILPVLLAGCGGIASSPPPTPGPADIAAEAAAIAGVNAPPSAYLQTGVELSNRSCGAQFNGLTQQANGLTFAQEETTLAGGVASGAAGLAGAPAAAVGGIGLFFPAVSQSLSNAARVATGGALPWAAFSLVQKAQSSYLSSLTAPTSLTEAAMDVSGYAQICQPAMVNLLVMQATLNATTTASGGAPPASIAGATGLGSTGSAFIGDRVRALPVISAR